MQDRPVKGAISIIISGLMFSIMGALIKKLSIGINNEMVVFLRNVCVLFFIGPVIFFKKKNLFYSKKVKLHLIRTLSGLTAMYLYFYTLSKMPLAEAVVISFTSPFFIPFVAFFWLGEKLTKRLIIASIGGFLGVLLILKPGTHVFNPIGIYGLLAAMGASIAMVSIRRMSETEPPLRIVFYYTLISTIISFFPALINWQSINLNQIFLAFLIGITGFTGQFFVTTGYTLAPAAKVGPFTYSSIFFAAMIGIFILGENFDMLTMSGGIIIMVAGVAAIRSKQ